jgi:hypothetical protein
MNWDAIGAIAELLGAIGVIASLVYLATQIRQNTRSVQGAAYQSLVVGQQALQSVSYDSETAEIIRRGMQDGSQLSETEAFRFNWLISGVVQGYENAMYQFETGMLAPERWQSQIANLRWFLASPGVRAWWSTFYKEHLAADFVRLVDEEIRRLEETEPSRGEEVE